MKAWTEIPQKSWNFRWISLWISQHKIKEGKTNMKQTIKKPNHKLENLQVNLQFNLPNEIKTAILRQCVGFAGAFWSFRSSSHKTSKNFMCRSWFLLVFVVFENRVEPRGFLEESRKNQKKWKNQEKMAEFESSAFLITGGARYLFFCVQCLFYDVIGSCT